MNYLFGIGRPLKYEEKYLTIDNKLRSFVSNGGCEACGFSYTCNNCGNEIQSEKELNACPKCNKKTLQKISMTIIFCPKCLENFCLEKCIKIKEVHEKPDSNPPSIWIGRNWVCPKCKSVLREWRVIHEEEDEPDDMNFACRRCGKGFLSSSNSPGICGKCMDEELKSKSRRHETEDRIEFRNYNK